MALFEYLYTLALIVFSVPIVLSFILRKIAGKHAPTYYDDCEACEQVRARRKARARRDDEVHHLIWWRD